MILLGQCEISFYLYIIFFYKHFKERLMHFFSNITFSTALTDLQRTCKIFSETSWLSDVKNLCRRDAKFLPSPNATQIKRGADTKRSIPSNSFHETSPMGRFMDVQRLS